MITAWSADGKRVETVTDLNQIETWSDETTQPSQSVSGGGDLSPQVCPSPSLSSLENSGASKAASPLFQRQGGE